MRKLLTITSLIGLLLSGNVVASELSKNTRPVAPTSSKSAYKQFSVDRFVLAGNTEADYRRLISSSARSFGSDNTKTIKIIWTNKKGADTIFNGLVKRGIDRDKIKLVRNDKRRPLYPIYVEVEQLSAKRMNCKSDTAEEMLMYNENDFCATRSNQNIQLKN